MREKFCDIVPSHGGWVYFIDGIESAVYPSYQMAVRAAKAEAEQRGAGGLKTVLRSQHLNGEMMRIGAVRTALAGRGLHAVS